MTSTFILDQLKRNKINDLLEKGQRYDGRRFDEPRPLTIETGVIPKADGSAVGCAKGKISAVQMKIPLSPISGKGLSGWIFIPVTTSVSPKRTRAEPSAFG